MKSILIDPSKQSVVKVTESAQYVLDLSNQNSENTLHLEFEKEGVEAQILGLFYLENNNSFKLTTVADHKVPNTSCWTSVKGVLGNKAVSSYIGKIIINKQAQKTSSYLDESVLVIGKNTNNQAQPILEIDANDVKASHGSTTGKINKDQLYYLQSRGLSQKESEMMIVEGFYNDLLAQISDDKIREQVQNNLFSALKKAK